MTKVESRDARRESIEGFYASYDEWLTAPTNADGERAVQNCIEKARFLLDQGYPLRPAMEQHLSRMGFNPKTLEPLQE